MTLKEKVSQVKTKNPDWGYKKIAKTLGCNSGTVRFHLNPKYKSDVTEARVRRRKERKQMLLAKFGNKCSICSYDKCDEALDFHHKDPLKKEFRLSELMNSTDAKAIKEAEKCILVCCRCHREIHANAVVV